MINRLTVITTSLVLLASPVLAETPPIEKIAPENSVLIVGARNARQASENFKRTGLWNLIQSEKIKAATADAMKEFDAGVQDMLKELGVEEDSLVAPTGAIGLALFSVPDPDLGVPRPGLLALADYAADAEKTDTLVKAALERGAKEDKLEFEEKDVGGRTVYVIDLSKMAPEPAADEDDGGMDMPMPGMPDPAEALKGLTKMHYVRDGGTLMLCSDLPALTNVLEIFDNKAQGKFDERDDYQNTISQVGSDSDAYALLLTRDIMDFVGPMGGPMVMMLRPTLRAAFGEVGGYAMTVRFDSGGAMVNWSVGAFMPNGKQGFTQLIDHPAPRAQHGVEEDPCEDPADQRHVDDRRLHRQALPR